MSFTIDFVTCMQPIENGNQSKCHLHNEISNNAIEKCKLLLSYLRNWITFLIMERSTTDLRTAKQKVYH